MPNWKFHNDWAVKLGIPKVIANWVNKREDLPKCEPSKDKGLRQLQDILPDYPPTYTEMAQKGNDYLRAWMLHILLDELESICENLGENSLKEFKTGTDLYKVAEAIFHTELLRLIPDDISQLVLNNINELLREMPIAYFQINRDLLLPATSTV